MRGIEPYRRLLGLPVPRRLALGCLPADFADWLDYAAIVALLVFVWGEGPWILAFFALALTLPYVVVGPLLAVFVDRAPLRTVLVLSNIGRAAATAGFILAPDPAWVLVLVFVRGSVDSAFTPARQGAIQASTPAELLSSANGLHQAINQASKIAGPAIGGVLLAVLPVQWIFGINTAFSLIAAAIFLTLVLPRAELAETEKPKGYLDAAFAGIREFRANRLLAAALLFCSFAYFGVFLYDALIALLVLELGFDATAFGISISVAGAAGLIGSLAAGALRTRRHLATMALAAIVSGAITVVLGSIATLGSTIPFGPYLVLMAVTAGSFAFMLVPYRTLIQEQAPPDRISRVFAAGEAVTMVVMMSAPFLGSLIATQFRTGSAFIAGGALMVFLGGVAIAQHLLRRPPL
jgi:MFS family permease